MTTLVTLIGLLFCGWMFDRIAKDDAIREERRKDTERRKREAADYLRNRFPDMYKNR